eukprot:c47325_g1_i1 orf=1-1176(-)
MAEAINIILEYLRQHNFTKAEAALQSELFARQEVTRTDFDIKLSLPTDSRKRDGIIYDKGPLLHVAGLESVSCSKESSSRSGLLYEKSKELDLTGVGARDVKSLALGLETEELDLQPEKFSIQSVKCATEERKKTGDGEVMKMEDIEPKQDYGKKKAHKDDNNMRDSERTAGVQNESEDKLFDIHQNGAFFFRPRSPQDLSECHPRIVKSSRGTKDKTVYEGLKCREVGQDQQSTNMFWQVSSCTVPKRWEELEGLSLHEAGDTSCQPDVGAPKLEKAAIVHESGEFSGRQFHPSDLKTALPRCIPSLEWSGNQCPSTVVTSYKAITENGWLDNGQPRYHFSVSSGKARPAKADFPYLFSCPSNEFSPAQLQHKEIQMDWEEKVEGAKAKGK